MSRRKLAAVDVLVCPGRGGHEFAPQTQDPERACVHCGARGRVEQVPGEVNPGHLSRAGAARAATFSGLKAPMQSGTGDPKLAHPKPDPEYEARLAKVRADVARDDRERPWHGQGSERRRMTPEEAAAYDEARAAMNGSGPGS